MAKDVSKIIREMRNAPPKSKKRLEDEDIFEKAIDASLENVGDTPEVSKGMEADFEVGSEEYDGWYGADPKSGNPRYADDEGNFDWRYDDGREADGPPTEKQKRNRFHKERRTQNIVRR